MLFMKGNNASISDFGKEDFFLRMQRALRSVDWNYIQYEKSTEHK